MAKRKEIIVTSNRVRSPRKRYRGEELTAYPLRTSLDMTNALATTMKKDYEKDGNWTLVRLMK